MPAPPAPQPGIMEIELYQGGASKLAGRDDVLKLSSNETPLGPPPSAIAAAQEAAGAMHLYPSTDHRALRETIAEVHGLDPDRIICSAGSDEIIHWLCQAYAGPGDEVLHPQYGFLMYPISARAAGATPVAAPETDRRVDVEALLAAATDRTKLCFLANPANPTGTFLDGQDIRRLADGLPDSCLLVLDGAYAEFVEDFDGGLGLTDVMDHVVCTRTFSKLYGLGGMRIGWGYGPRPIIDVLNRLRGPFNLSGPALAAATAAMADRDYAAAGYQENARQRTRLRDGLLKLGIACDPSMANFVLARFADDIEAVECNEFLKSQGILVRHVASYGLPHCLRITVGTEAQVDRVLAALHAWMVPS